MWGELNRISKGQKNWKDRGKGEGMKELTEVEGKKNKWMEEIRDWEKVKREIEIAGERERDR